MSGYLCVYGQLHDFHKAAVTDHVVFSIAKNNMLGGGSLPQCYKPRQYRRSTYQRLYGSVKHPSMQAIHHR